MKPVNETYGALNDRVTVVVLTLNEEPTIGETLRHLSAFSHIIIVDSGSTDRTASIARSMGATVIDFQWNGNYPKKKQWALENAPIRTEWILLLDADEYPSANLVDEMQRAFAAGIASEVDAFDLLLSYRFAGRLLKYGHVVRKRSLLRAGRCRFPEVGDLHLPGIREVEGHYQPEVTGMVSTMEARLIHDDRDPVGSWFDRHNRYAEWEAHLLNDRHLHRAVAEKRSSRGRLFARVPMKPLLFFVYCYIFRLGFLDGRAGRDYAVGLAAYYWQIEVRARDLRERAR